MVVEVAQVFSNDQVVELLYREGGSFTVLFGRCDIFMELFEITDIIPQGMR
jgi:hypothetical protein